MTVEEELTSTAESVRLSETAETLYDLVSSLEADAKLSAKHGAEFDYIASKLATLAKECKQYEEEFAREAE